MSSAGGSGGDRHWKALLAVAEQEYQKEKRSGAGARRASASAGQSAGRDLSAKPGRSGSVSARDESPASPGAGAVAKAAGESVRREMDAGGRRASSSVPAPSAPVEDGTIGARAGSRARAIKAARVRQQKEALGLPATGAGHSDVDLTHHLAESLDVGADGREYVRKDVRRAMERDIAGSETDLSDPKVPEMVRRMTAALRSADGSSVMDVNERDVKAGTGSRTVGYRHDEALAASREKRKAADTGAPESPTPAPETEWARQEFAHLVPFASGHGVNATVHAPTQVNQVADSAHERHAASAGSGGVLVRHVDSREYSQFSVSADDRVRQSHVHRSRPDGGAAAASSAAGAGSSGADGAKGGGSSPHGQGPVTGAGKGPA